MSYSFKKTFTAFTPAEAERITGVSVVLQRDWRRRKIIPARQDGEARFLLPALLEMLTLKMLSEAGLGIEEAREWCPFVPAAIASHALVVDGAIEGDVDLHPLGLRYPEILAKEISAQISRAIPGGDLVIWSDRKSEVVRDWRSAIEQAPHSKLCGAVRILIFEAIGTELAKRAGRALVHIEREEL